MHKCELLEKFYLCIKSKMEKYRGTCDVNKIQNAHCVAVKEGPKGILNMVEGG
jgi:hypothetical protein